MSSKLFMNTVENVSLSRGGLKAVSVTSSILYNVKIYANGSVRDKSGYEYLLLPRKYYC